MASLMPASAGIPLEKLTEDSRLKTRTAHWTIRKERPHARVAAGGLPFPAFPDCFGWGKWGSRSKIHWIRVPLLSFDPSNQRDNYTTDTANTRVTKVTNLLGIVSIVRYPCTFAKRFQFVSSLCRDPSLRIGLRRMKARVRIEFRHPHQDVIDETALRQLQLTKRARQKLRITRWETLCQLPKPPSAGLQANYFAFATRPFRSSPSPYAHNLRRKGGGWEKITDDSRLKTRTAH